MDTKKKICRRCKKEKLESEFHKNKLDCISCERIKGRANYRRKKAREKSRIEKYNFRRTSEGRAQYLAHRSIAKGIKNGTVKKTDFCDWCGVKGKRIQAHHWLYLPKYRRFVIWVCDSDHRKFDKIREMLEKKGDIESLIRLAEETVLKDKSEFLAHFLLYIK